MVRTNRTELNAADEAFAARLDELDVRRIELCRDPSGHTWLPADLRERVAREPACAAALAVFVARERAAFDGAAAAPDVWFAARVMKALPPSETLDVRRRLAILGGAYCAAAAVAYCALLSGADVSELHSWYGDLGTFAQPSELSNLWIAATLVASCVGLLLFGGRHVVSEGQWSQTPMPATPDATGASDILDGVR